MSGSVRYRDLSPWAVGTAKTIRLNMSVDGVPTPLAGVTFKLWLVEGDGEPNGLAVVEKTVTAPESEFTAAITLSEADSLNLEAKTYYYRINAIIGGESRRILKGKIPVEL